MTEKANEINCYVCSLCGKAIKTINRDEGTTPMFLKCKATDGCPGMMTSTWYKVPERWQDLAITFEWFRPKNPKKYVKKIRQKWERQAVLHHIEQGGLELREISNANPEP